MNFLKDKDLVTPEYVAKLEEHLIATQATFFDPTNEADAWCDFIRWPNKKTDRDHLCMPKEPFLVDRSLPTVVGGEHWYCICTISENGRVTSEVPVTRIANLNRHHWRNGYFLLPIFK